MSTQNTITPKELVPDDWTIDDLAPYLQAWLYFGTLHHIFKSLIRSNYKAGDFVKEDLDGQMVIHTKNLPYYIFNWATRESCVPRDEEYGLARVVTVLHLLEFVFIRIRRRREELFVEQEPRIISVDTPGHLVLLSITILYETLLKAAHEIYRHLNHGLLPSPPELNTILITRYLGLAGWCPSEIQHIYSMPETSCTTAYFLTMVDRTGLNKDHTTCLSSDRCGAYDVDYDTYETKHTHPDCDCEFLPQKEGTVSLSVSWILHDGYLPLFSFHEARDNTEAMLEVTCCPLDNPDEILPYVAISHVWSDGLGNQEQNSLPLCVLRKIQEQVDECLEPVYRPGYFWIDTICVPKTDKLPALELMLRTYTEAYVVLVLDASLQTLSIKARPQEQLLLTTVSPWMQRLWTLQEGRVASRLVFQFADAARWAGDIVHDCVRTRSRMKTPPLLPLEEGDDVIWHNKFLVRTLRAQAVYFHIEGVGAHDAYPSMWHEGVKQYRRYLEENEPAFPKEADRWLARFMHRSHTLDLTFGHDESRFASLQGTPDKNLSYTDEIIETYRLLQFRTTSRKEDEFYCLANLTRVPVLPILSVPPEARMQKLLSLMSAVPAAIIFWDSVPRMTGDCFTWAPKSLLGNTPIAGTDYMNLLGYIRNGELNVSFPGWKVVRPPPERQADGVFDSETSSSSTATDALSLSGTETQIVRLLASDPQDCWEYCLICAGESSLQTRFQDFNEPDLRVILRSNFPTTTTATTTTSSQQAWDGVKLDGSVIPGALVTELECAGTSSLVKYLLPVFVSHHGQISEKLSASHDRFACAHYHRFEKLDDAHLWRIV